MLNFIVFFYKRNPFKLKEVTKCFLYTEIILLCKFVYTCKASYSLANACFHRNLSIFLITFLFIFFCNSSYFCWYNIQKFMISCTFSGNLTNLYFHISPCFLHFSLTDFYLQLKKMNKRKRPHFYDLSLFDIIFHKCSPRYIFLQCM